MRLLIASSVTHYRQALASALERSGPIAEARGADADSLVAPSVLRFAPDVVLAVLLVAGDMALVRKARLTFPDAPIVAISLAPAEGDGDVVGCVRAGVQGFVTRDQSFHDLLAALCSAGRGEHAWSNVATALLLRHLEESGNRWSGAALRSDETDEPRRISVAPPRSVPDVETIPMPQPCDGPIVEPVRRGPAIAKEFNLTSRQQEVLRHVAEGLSNKEIARELDIELPTVKHHVHQILRKLGVTRRTAAIALVHRPSAGFPGAHAPSAWPTRE